MSPPMDAKRDQNDILTKQQLHITEIQYNSTEQATISVHCTITVTVTHHNKEKKTWFSL